MPDIIHSYKTLHIIEDDFKKKKMASPNKIQSSDQIGLKLFPYHACDTKRSVIERIKIRIYFKRSCYALHMIMIIGFHFLCVFICEIH